MRFLLNFIVMAFLSLALFPHSAASQTDDAQATSPNLLNATQEQTQEAKTFYSRCSKNETMSKYKDCACAATAYLKTRIELGNSATVDQIMAANAKECLLDPTSAESFNTNKDLSHIADKQLEEAEGIFKKCQADKRLNTRYDCECYAAKFLDKRLELGPMKGQDLIISKLQNSCVNVVEGTGHEYDVCMNTHKKPVMGMGLDNINRKDYCDCYAGEWGKMMKAFSDNPNTDGMRRFDVEKKIRSSASHYCTNLLNGQ